MEAIEILAQLDEAAEEFVFPDLGHAYYYAVDARLHAYRDDDRWALIVETVGYSPRAGSLQDVVHVFGNCLTTGGPGLVESDFLGRIDNWYEIEDLYDREVFLGGPVVVRGRTINVPGERGEDLYDVLRRLVPDHRDLLLADETELRQRIPADLPEVLRLDEWHQPDVINHLPSESETYRQLAEVLATGDLGRYVPSQPPNTHWSNWLESGNL